MTSRADVLLEDFGKNLNIPNMSFDEDGLCSFKVDDRYHISILSNSEESIFIYGLLGKLNSNFRDDAFALLLSTNLYLAEANLHTIAFEPKMSMLILAKSYSLDGLDAVSIENIIDKLSEQIAEISTNLKEEAGIELQEPQ